MATINGSTEKFPGLFYDKGGAVYNALHPEFDITGDGVTDDSAAITAMDSAVTGMLVFGPGTYKLSSDVTLSNAVQVMPGGKFLIDSGKTLTINGSFRAELTQAFSGSGTTRLGLGAVLEIYPEWWYSGSGVYDDALDAAMASIPSAAGKRGTPIVFSHKIYEFDTTIIPPDDGTENIAQSFQGVRGGVAKRMAMLQYNGTGAGQIFFDFSGAKARLAMRDLYLTHKNVPSAADTNGIGIKLGESRHTILENLWVAQFDIGIKVNNVAIYSRYSQIRCIGNYTNGFKGEDAGFLLNGAGFDNCQFSKTIAGKGLHLFAPGVAINFASCWFEGNSDMGCFIETFTNVKFDNCYWELNGDTGLKNKVMTQCGNIQKPSSVKGRNGISILIDRTCCIEPESGFEPPTSALQMPCSTN